MIEVWKDVRDYEGLYIVSNLGRLKSLSYNSTGQVKLLKTYKRGGYQTIQLSNKGVKKMCRVNRLVFEAFYRRCLPNEDVHHINQIRDDNRPENLVAKDKSLHTKEHKLGKASWNKGKTGFKDTQQTKRKKSEALKHFYETHTSHKFGKKWSEESILKRTATRKRNKELKSSN